MQVQFFLIWDSRDRDWFEFLWRWRLLMSIFLFPLSPVKRIGQMKNNLVTLLLLLGLWVARFSY